MENNCLYCGQPNSDFHNCGKLVCPDCGKVLTVLDDWETTRIYCICGFSVDSLNEFHAVCDLNATRLYAQNEIANLRNALLLAYNKLVEYASDDDCARGFGAGTQADPDEFISETVNVIREALHLSPL